MDEATIQAANLPVKRTETHIYFFGYEGPDPEVCFQQWYPSPFVDKDLAGSPSFPTSEHYMMYRKALLFGDKAVAGDILAAITPGEAKALGRKAGPFDQPKWDGSCDAIVQQGNFLKFSQNPELKAILLGTGDKIIVEASPSDRIWGIGFDAEHAAGKEKEWGKNKLGEALMRVRKRLNE
ncbi:N-glycosidase [Lachnellula cervina]|uniref:N-glycosidase n=1 Tax=Lachnellula cervina TaxID=1316786 RepID=A0A7D8YUM4_9HELO|nr:N-glycosidase [Lachnellula cervina]